jgi:hypothetical protein
MVMAYPLVRPPAKTTIHAAAWFGLEFRILDFRFQISISVLGFTLRPPPPGARQRRLMCKPNGEDAPATALFAHIKINLDIDVQQQGQKCRPSACVCAECKSI